MKRHLVLTLIMGVLVTLLAVVVTAESSPASAATTCQTVKGSKGFGDRRFCQVNSNSRYDRGNVNLNINWEYKDDDSRGDPQTGRVVGRITNFNANQCTYLYFKHTTAPQGNELWVKACGKNGKKAVDANLNGTLNSTGYINIYVCYSHSTGSCSLVWQQNIAQKSPRKD